MLQLRFFREEQEKRIHDAVTKTANEYEKRIMGLQEKLNESNKKVSKLGLENTQLVTTLSSKEKIINELHSNRAQLEYDLSNIEEKRILDKMNRQKVSEVEKLAQIVRELQLVELLPMLCVIFSASCKKQMKRRGSWTVN